jgi:hypothetical protein
MCVIIFALQPFIAARPRRKNLIYYSYDLCSEMCQIFISYNRRDCLHCKGFYIYFSIISSSETVPSYKQADLVHFLFLAVSCFPLQLLYVAVVIKKVLLNRDGKAFFTARSFYIDQFLFNCDVPLIRSALCQFMHT